MREKKINILYIHHGTGIGGALISLRNLISALNSDLYAITVLCLKYSEGIDYFRIRGIDCRIVKSKFYNNQYTRFTHSEPGMIKWYQPIRFFKALSSYFLSKYYYAPKILADFDFDILHLNSVSLVDWLYAGNKVGKTITYMLTSQFGVTYCCDVHM